MYMAAESKGHVTLTCHSDISLWCHRGHPGGQRIVKAADMLARKPTFLIEKAVRGMLPKTKLGRKVFSNLHVYAGSEHPHQAQQPQKLDI